MKRLAYYNEFDPKAAAWLRELIKQGAIAPGDVDGRSIKDVQSSDLAGYRQCHFFAGIGVWSYALQLARWPEDREVWTGSCPCQPFSAAGKHGGVDDERHLWPAFFDLIRERSPDVVFGEQVASKDGLGWLDLVHADMEGAGYAIGAIDSCAAGFGAPHIRQRLYWVADSGSERREGLRLHAQPRPARLCQPETRRCVEAGGLAHGERTGLERHGRDGNEGHEPGRIGARPHGSAAEEGAAGGVADASGQRHESDHNGGGRAGSGAQGADQLSCGGGAHSGPAPTHGVWGSPDWLFCRDGKWRPVEPGSFPLAHGAPARVGRLRGYGNALVAPQAQAFIESYLDLVSNS